MKQEKQIHMGMPLIKWTHESCTVMVAEGNKWATIYTVESSDKGKGHATALLKHLKEHYKDKEFGCSVALNDGMSRILKKLEIAEYS